MAIARAEAARLEGQMDKAITATGAAFAFSRAKNSLYTTGLAYWRWRAGLEPEIPEVRDDPYSLEMSGEWAQAAAAWATMGCPYESALALASANEEPGLRQALTELQRLGARPAASFVTLKLRECGVRRVPPRASAEDPAQPRQPDPARG